MVCMAALLAPFLWAEEAADRAAIERTFAALNAGLAKQDRTPVSELFAEGPDSGLDFLLTLSSTQPWSEVTTPRYTVQKIQFVTSEVALVDGTSTQFGSLILSQVRWLLFEMTRKGEGWQIASVRFADPPPRPPEALTQAPVVR